MYACESYLNLGPVPHSMQIAILSYRLTWWRTRINRWCNHNWEMPRVVIYLGPLSQLMWWFHFCKLRCRVFSQSVCRYISRVGVHLEYFFFFLHLHFTELIFSGRFSFKELVFYLSTDVALTAILNYLIFRTIWFP